MAEVEVEAVDKKPFCIERARSGQSKCKKCKEAIKKGELRMGKLGYNHFAPEKPMFCWHHIPCMFLVFSKQRSTTKRIDSYSEIEGWENLAEEDRQTVKGHFPREELQKLEESAVAEAAGASAVASGSNPPPSQNKDNSFRQFRKICSELTNASGSLKKTSIVKEFFDKGCDGVAFKGDLLLWCKSLLPMVKGRVYNLQSKQLVKIFSVIFGADQDEMLEDLEAGDVALTIGNFFEKSVKVTPLKGAVLTLHQVDIFLDNLSKLTREADQIDHFKSILPKCSTNDLKMIIRLIKHDLKMEAGPKPILDALDGNAYAAFRASQDLHVVVAKVLASKKKDNKAHDAPTTIKVEVSVMTPVKPMLAQACKSVEMALAKCPQGMFSEIKYDGERVQLHKQANHFKYFSRSLKPVMAHKVRHFEEYIPKAFPHAGDLIIDSEILMVNTCTGQPLPFGTLGAHKQAECKDACVCLFVFDCIYYNGQSLVGRPIIERRKILQDNINVIQNRVMLSEIKEIHNSTELEAMVVRVLRQGLEGLVLKPLESKYEPGKRHWLKVKKDYLAGGSMADSADLVVLGAWYGSGKKGGIMSVFLMGCYDERRGRWVTVTKVHGGHDDETLDALQSQLHMNKISQDAARLPKWLHCTATMVPDLVIKDPQRSQVWQISGAEFTCNQVHTADGISIRFPRVTRIRDDKDWQTATSLAELKQLYAASKDTSNFTLKQDPSHPPPNKQTNKAEKLTDQDIKTEITSMNEKEKTPVKKEKKVRDKGHPSHSRTSPKTENKQDEPDSGFARSSETECSTPESTSKCAKRKGSGSRKRSTDSPSTSSDKKGKQFSPTRQREVSTEQKQDEPDSGFSRSSQSVAHSTTEIEIKSTKRKRTKSSDSYSTFEKESKIRESSNTSTGRKDCDAESSSSKTNDSTTPGTSQGQQSSSSKTRNSKPDRNDRCGEKSANEGTRSDGGSQRAKQDKSGQEAAGSHDRERGGKDKHRVNKESHSKSSSEKHRNKASPVSGKFTARDDGNSKNSNKRERCETAEQPRKLQRTVVESSGSETEIDEDSLPTADVTIDMRNQLPDVFNGRVILLHGDVPDGPILRRFIIAYGGRVCSASESATHVVYPRRKVGRKLDDSSTAHAHHVTAKWLWSSITHKRIASEAQFAINL